MARYKFLYCIVYRMMKLGGIGTLYKNPYRVRIWGSYPPGCAPQKNAALGYEYIWLWENQRRLSSFTCEIKDWNNNFTSLSLYSSTLLRILLGDFDFNYLATSYPVCGTIFFLLYIVFIFFIVSNLFVVVMFVCFNAVRRDVARRQKPFYLVDLLNKVLYTAWV